MNYDEWLAYRWRWCSEHPHQLPTLRLDVELTLPRWKLDEVPIEFNPHRHGGGFGPRHLFYECDDWTMRSEPQLITPNPHGEITWRFIVESGHREGDRLKLLSTSCSIVHESWAAQKNWNDFAFFNGRYWRVTWNEYFGDWPGGIVKGLPFQDRRHLDKAKGWPRPSGLMRDLLPPASFLRS